MRRERGVTRVIAWSALAVPLLGGSLIAAARSHAQSPAPQASAVLPFAVGERLVYVMRDGPKGSSGRGVMWIEPADPIRETPVMRLRSEFRVRLAFMRGIDRSDSWLDPRRMAALRFEKREQHPFSKDEQRVEVFPLERRWVASDSSRGESPTDAPLDELSFIYFVRSLELQAPGPFDISRHFDIDRNPVVLRVRGRETIETRAGTFETTVVEMRVKDPRRPDRDGVVTLYLSEDRHRIPVRIVSRMPVLGRAEFTLDSLTLGTPPVAASGKPAPR